MASVSKSSLPLAGPVVCDWDTFTASAGGYTGEEEEPTDMKIENTIRAIGKLVWNDGATGQHRANGETGSILGLGGGPGITSKSAASGLGGARGVFSDTRKIGQDGIVGGGLGGQIIASVLGGAGMGDAGAAAGGMDIGAIIGQVAGGGVGGGILLAIIKLISGVFKK